MRKREYAAFNDISEYGWVFIMSDRSSEVLSAAADLILITILTQDKITVKMVITPETLLTN